MTWTDIETKLYAVNGIEGVDEAERSILLSGYFTAERLEEIAKEARAAFGSGSTHE